MARIRRSGILSELIDDQLGTIFNFGNGTRRIKVGGRGSCGLESTANRRVNFGKE